MRHRAFTRVSAGGILPALVLALMAAEAGAQETGRIGGEVTSGATPLAGVQVVVERLNLGAITDAAGRFLISNIPAGTHTVRVELIGYESARQAVEVQAGATATADFELTQTAISLEEVVVTGTAAEVRAREVGNSLDAVTSRDIETLPVTNPENILGGRVPGVTISQAGGQAGSGGTIRIRGQTTASQTAEPLLYVDGVRVYNLPISIGTASRAAVSALQDIHAEDIERIEVIKGASATTLYGTEASGGVIQIFTKRGVAGAPIWTAEVTTGFQSQGHVGPDSDPTQLYTQCSRDDLFSLSQSSDNLGERVFFTDPTCPSNGSWFRNGAQQQYNLSVRGGSADASYYVSGTFNDQRGTVRTQRNRDGGIRANLDFAPFDDIKLSLNAAYNRRSTNFVEDGNNANGMLLNIGRGTNGNFKGGRPGEGTCDDVSDEVLCVTNAFLFESDNVATTNRYTLGFITQYEPVPGLTHRFATGFDFLRFENEELDPFGHLRNPEGFFSTELQSRERLSLDYTGSYRNNLFGLLGENVVSTFSWGGQLFRDRSRDEFVSTEQFAGPGQPDLTSGGGPTGVDDAKLGVTTAGFFFQEVLGFSDRFFLTGGVRFDGSSAFGDDFGIEVYPKVSGSYIVSDHDFWPRQLFDTFKLRGAFGISGKAPGAFDKFRTFTPATAEEGAPGFTPAALGNQAVKAERTREVEVGFDASLFQGRFGLETTYYNTKTTDALVPVTSPPSQGFLTTQVENIGQLSGRGWEFQVTGVPVRTSGFEWRLRTNLSFIDTNADDLDGQQIAGGNSAEIREGVPVPAYFGSKVVNAGEFADPMIETDQFLGDVNATRLVGITSTFTFGQNLLLDVLLEHHGGHSLLNATGYQNARRGAWQPCFAVQDALLAQSQGDESLIQQYTAGERARCRMNGLGGHDITFWIEDASFWKLRSVALSYTLPNRLVQGFASRATVTLSGSNLLTWTDYSGLDPEAEDFRDRAGGGIFDGTGDFGRREYYSIPPARAFLLSLRLTF